MALPEYLALSWFDREALCLALEEQIEKHNDLFDD
jgi:hypothetical protein